MFRGLTEVRFAVRGAPWRRSFAAHRHRRASVFGATSGVTGCPKSPRTGASNRERFSFIYGRETRGSLGLGGEGPYRDGQGHPVDSRSIGERIAIERRRSRIHRERIRSRSAGRKRDVFRADVRARREAVGGEPQEVQGVARCGHRSGHSLVRKDRRLLPRFDIPRRRCKSRRRDREGRAPRRAGQPHGERGRFDRSARPQDRGRHRPSEQGVAASELEESRARARGAAYRHSDPWHRRVAKQGRVRSRRLGCSRFVPRRRSIFASGSRPTTWASSSPSGDGVQGKQPKRRRLAARALPKRIRRRPKRRCAVSRSGAW